MKLVVQIPALNEVETIAQTIRAIPRRIQGISSVEVLLIDDGSTDGTALQAKSAGADHILHLGSHVGLARAFSAGIEEAIRLGADIIVNTDADNQYCADDIPALVRPILRRQAEIVIGCRPISEIADFSPMKKLLQRFGSWVVRKASGTGVPDAPSGFRAYSRGAAARLCVTGTFSYTLETIIQAGRRHIPMTWVPVRVNRVTRPSRLFRGTGEYVIRSATIILRSSLVYGPQRIFNALALACAAPWLFGSAARMFGLKTSGATTLLQPSQLPEMLMASSIVLIAIGLLASLVSSNRIVLEDVRTREILRGHDPISARPRLAPILEVVDAR